MESMRPDVGGFIEPRRRTALHTALHHGPEHTPLHASLQPSGGSSLQVRLSKVKTTSSPDRQVPGQPLVTSVAFLPGHRHVIRPFHGFGTRRRCQVLRGGSSSHQPLAPTLRYDDWRLLMWAPTGSGPVIASESKHSHGLCNSVTIYATFSAPASSRFRTGWGSENQVSRSQTGRRRPLFTRPRCALDFSWICWARFFASPKDVEKETDSNRSSHPLSKQEAKIQTGAGVGELRQLIV